MNNKLSIVIPLYNEEWNIKPLLDSFKKFINYDFELILVNDWSKDNTEKLLKDFQRNYHFFDYISYDKNKWYWWAILKWLSKVNWDVLSWMHSDLQTDTKYIFKAYDIFIKSDSKNILIKWKRKNRNFSQILFSNTMGVICSLVFFKKLFEINAQPKLFSRNLYNNFKSPPNDFSLDLYLLVLAKKWWYHVYDIDVNFIDRQFWKSKWAYSFKSKIKTIIRTLKYIFKLSTWLK